MRFLTVFIAKTNPQIVLPQWHACVLRFLQRDATLGNPLAQADASWCASRGEESWRLSSSGVIEWRFLR